MRRVLVGTTAAVALAIVVAVTAVVFVRFHPVFGGEPDATSRARIEASPQFDGTRLVNAEPTAIDTATGESPGMLAWLSSTVRPPPGKHPAEPLPSVRLAAGQLAEGHLAWLGHSTVIFRMAGKTLVTDPVFHRASPIALGGKSFPVQTPTTVADLPPVDAVLISHDHYDHLDYRAIQEMDAKVGHYFVPLGVKAHLQRWGVADERITEMDWHERAMLGEVELVMAPARHFSGRKLGNRFSTLWSSWVVRSPGWSLYFNGDSGHGAHFAEIGNRYGPFDIALVENGAYNQNWSQIHMHPEQAARAGSELRTQVVMPMHWAKFDLAYHTWREPIERFLDAVEGQPFRTATPQIGRVFHHADPPRERWWKGAR